MPSERQQLFLEGPIGAALFRLAVPIILGNVLQTGYQLTDAFWIGRLGAAAVAAVSVSFPVTFLVIALGAGFGIAGATLSAQYMGAGRQDMVNHVAAQTMLLVLVTSAVLGTAGYILAPYLLELVGVAPDVYSGALGFMRVSFIGIVFVFLYGMFQALMRGVGETRIPLLIVLLTVLLNFLLDPLFIFGWGPLSPHGVMGAAMATLATQALAALLGLAVFLRGRHGIHLSWRAFAPDPSYIKRAFRLGLPGSIELSTRGLGPMLLSFLVASFGTVTLASYGVGSNILLFVTIPAMGMSMAVSTLVSQNIGAGNIGRAERITVLGAGSGFAILSLAGAAAWSIGAGSGGVLRTGCTRRDRGRRPVCPDHVPGMGRHRHSALRRFGIPRLRQHAGLDGDRAGLAVRVSISTGLCAVETHKPAVRRAVVVISDRQYRRRRCLDRPVRARRLEGHPLDRRKPATRQGRRGNHCRGRHTLSRLPGRPPA